MGAQSTQTTAKHLGLTIGRGTFQECLNCSISKAHQKNLSTISENVSEPGDLFSSDISSSSSPAYGGTKYWLLVVDHATNMKWTFLLKCKDQQTEVLVNFVKELHGNHNIKIKCWCMDNAGENKKNIRSIYQKRIRYHPGIYHP